MKASFKHFITGLSLLTLTSLSGFSQKSDREKPRWMHSSVEPSNSTFVYDVVTSDATTLGEARDKALSALLIQSGLEGGQTVKTDVVSDAHETHISQNGHTEKAGQETIRVHTTLMGQPATLTAKKIDEYWERKQDGTYHLTTLYARSQVDGTPRFDNVKLTTNYGLHGLWRSAIVPGWGQLYKGSTLKGGLIMGGTVLCIGAVIYTECMRVSYNSKITKTHDANLKRKYADTRSNYATGRNICIGALCALYVYNIVDAIVAPGARRILTSPYGNKNFSYFLTPTITDDFGAGFMASFTF